MAKCGPSLPVSKIADDNFIRLDQIDGALLVCNAPEWFT